MDTSKVGLTAARMMEVLERDYEDGELIEAMIVVEVARDDEDGKHTYTPTYCTNDSRVYQSGLLGWAYDLSTGDAIPGDAAEDDGPDDD